MNEICAVLAAFSAAIGAVMAFMARSWALGFCSLAVGLLAFGFFVGRAGI